MNFDFVNKVTKDLEKSGITVGASEPPKYWFSTGNYVLNKIISGSFLNGVPQGRLLAFTGPSGSGKAQPLHSKILTPNGWIRMGDVKMGDDVTTPDGQTSKVTHVHPQGEKDIYTITFSDGSSTECCIDHLWECWIYNEYQRTSIKQVVDTKFLIQYMNHQQTKKNKHNVSIDLISPIQSDNVDLPMDPYLLGALLGDRSVTTSTPMFTSSDNEIIEHIQNIVESDGYILTQKKHDCYSYKIRKIKHKPSAVNMFTETLKNLGIWGCRSHEKFIPSVYKNSSIEQRMDLIRGLMDIDGTVCKRGNVSYGTTSYQLALDLQEILWSLGAKCSITSRVPQYKNQNGIKINGKLFFTLNIHFKHPKQLFTLLRKQERCRPESDATQFRRKIKSIELTSVAEAQCITIDHPEQLYITDDYIITHNSFLVGNSLREAQKQGAYLVVLDSEHALDDDFVSKIGVDVNNNYTYIEIDTVSQCKKVVSAFLRGYKAEYEGLEDAPKVVIAIDSLDMMMTDTEQERFDKGITKGDQGQRNKQLKAMLREFVQAIKHLNVSIIVTDGVYKNQDVLNGEGLWIVKDAIRFSLSQVLLLSKLKLRDTTAGSRDVQGIKMKCEGYKTRFTKPFQTVTLEVPYDTGMDPYNGILDVAKQLGVVIQKGSWFYLTEDESIKFQSKSLYLYQKQILEQCEAKREKFLNANVSDNDVVTDASKSATQKRQEKFDEDQS